MMVDIIVPICATATTPSWVSASFARPYDLSKGTVGERLKMIKPTIFLGVPRVWEKIAEKMKKIGAKTVLLYHSHMTTICLPFDFHVTAIRLPYVYYITTMPLPGRP